MRLIDADKLVDTLPKVDITSDKQISKVGAIADFICIVAEQPTIDPVKHGKWEEWSGMIPVGLEGKHHCSLCGGRAPYDAGFHERLTDWCPGCGAKMDERPLTALKGNMESCGQDVPQWLDRLHNGG